MVGRPAHPGPNVPVAAERNAVPKSKKDHSVPGEVQDLSRLLFAYLRQETIEPIRDLGRFVAFGLAGSILLGLGLSMLMLSALRFLQTETAGAFDGHLSWLPYLITLFGCGVVAATAMKARTGGRKERP